MKKALIIVAITISLLSSGFSSFERRIFHGNDAAKGEFPYMANIRASGLTCGGALISKKFVLTAAHCFLGHSKDDDIVVILGTRGYWYSSRKPYAVKFKTSMKYWVHENFTMPSALHDIAVIQLPNPVELSERISPIKISRDRRIDRDGEKVVAVISGWGNTESNEPAEVLQTAKMKLVPISDCLKFQKHYVETLTADHICALGLSNGTELAVGPCDGDSGGKSQNN